MFKALKNLRLLNLKTQQLSYETTLALLSEVKKKTKALQIGNFGQELNEQQRKELEEAKSLLEQMQEWIIKELDSHDKKSLLQYQQELKQYAQELARSFSPSPSSAEVQIQLIRENFANLIELIQRQEQFIKSKEILLAEIKSCIHNIIALKTDINLKNNTLPSYPLLFGNISLPYPNQNAKYPSIYHNFP